MFSSARRALAVVPAVGALCAAVLAIPACDKPGQAGPAAKVIVVPDAGPAARILDASGMNWLEMYLAAETRGAGATSATPGR